MTITIAGRFNGPDASGNGGYGAGLIAAALNESINVRLHRPLPLDVPLAITDVEHRWEVHAGHELIATAMPAQLAVEVPRPPSYVEALDASRHYPGFTHHHFPNCFVCGPKRARGDGLRIYPGPVASGGMVVAPWMPDAQVVDEVGKTRPEFLWAVLDCPGFFATAIAPNKGLLGEIGVHINRLVHLDEPCTVIAWPISIERRKHRVGTALFDEEGECCAIGVSTWIQVSSS
jgi:hypothetical protein